MSSPDERTCVQYDANIDDMDPRLLPHAIDRLLAVGADDAWITPIVMKKGRPAFTLSALCDPSVAEAVRTVFFTDTTTIGLREQRVRKFALPRRVEHLEVDGHRLDTKVASLGDDVVNRSIEWDDVIAAAEALGLSPKQVLALATTRLP